jgi:Fe-S-cluster containining protein
MECRKCGACCAALSISSPIPGMPEGKPAGTRCVHLGDKDLCEIYTDPGRPRACSEFPPMPDTCGSSREEALALMSAMEEMTKPGMNA